VTARRTLEASYLGPWGRASDRRRFRPVRLKSDADGRLLAEAVPWKGSGDPFALARAEALAVLREGRPAPDEGEARVEVVPLGPYA
jgi:molybdopterin biosynthesis enzyme